MSHKKASLRAGATRYIHLLTHTPASPYCETRQLAKMDEVKALPKNKDMREEAKQDNNDSGVNFKRKGDVDSFNLGEKVLDMNEETLELAMEEEEEKEDGVHIAQAMVKNATSFL